jgi:hypothetical protein
MLSILRCLDSRLTDGSKAGGFKYGDLTLRVGESQMRQQNMVVSSAGFGPESDGSGKAQKQLYE